MAEAAVQQAPAAPAPGGGVSGGTIFIGITVFVVIAILAYLMLGPKKTIPGPTTKSPIPGVKPGAKSTSLGFLTDPNFFSGISNLATSLAHLGSTKAPASTGGGVAIPGNQDPGAGLVDGPLGGDTSDQLGYGGSNLPGNTDPGAGLVDY